MITKLLVVLPVFTTIGFAGDWQMWSPRQDLAPKFETQGSREGQVLSIRTSSFSQYGEWYKVVPGIRAGATYRFSVLSRADSVAREDVSVAAILTWCREDCTEDAIQRDYADRQLDAGQWRVNYRVLRAPQGARTLKIELVLRWTPAGSVSWKDVKLTGTDAAAPRMVRIATTHLTPPIPSTIEANLKQMGLMLDKAGSQKADIVCLSENVIGRGVDMPVPERAKSVAQPLSQLLAEKARQYRMYVVTAFEEWDNGVVHNTAVLFDRQGKLAAKYRKIHLPLAEAEMGYTPGSDYAVVDTDFGRIGILICWDYWFPEPARILRLKGAEMLLLPLAGDGGRHWDVITRARAIDNAMYVVASGVVPASSSRIVDPWGEVLAETSGEFGLAVQDIDLNKESRAPWLSVGPGLGEARSLYIKERRTDTYGPLLESGGR